MAPYLILDGYNVIGALDRYGREAASLDDAREMLVNDALKVAGWTGRTVVVVFDAHRSSEPERVERRAGGAVRVIYSAPGELADDVIERLAGSLDGGFTVYTGDFAIQRTTLARGGTRATPREFGDLLDELPAVSRSPETPRSTKLLDHLPPEALLQLERLRRRMDGEPEGD